MSDWIAHYGIKRRSGRYPWGSGKQPYQNDANKLANDVYEWSSKIEPRITSAVQKAAKIAGVKMYGLDHRLKTKESLARKIKTDAEEKHMSEKQVAKNLNDSIRYTCVQNNKNFVDSYFKVKNSLEELGYKEIKCKNYFEQYRKGLAKHKQVTSVFRGGITKFEVQFQTPESLSAKEKKTPIYEERRSLGLSEQRKQELESKMMQLMDPVPIPDNISKIKEH